MRAIVLEAAGDPSILIVRDGIPEPQPLGEEIRVRVRSFGLNRADVLQRRGRYPAPPDAIDPRIPGLEYAGEVEALGSRAREYNVGDRVMGITGAGAYAELLCVHERTAVRIPAGLSFEEAGAVPEAFMTAFDALEQGGFPPAGAALIHAVGSGVGIAGMQLVRAAGGIAIGTSRNAGKLSRAKELGLSAGALLDEEWSKLAKTQTSGNGVDVILEFLGPATYARNIAALRTGGTIVQIGTLAGSKGEIDLGLLMGKRARLIGTTLRARPLEEKIALSRRFERLVVPLFEAGKLRPVVDAVYDFERTGEAHQHMEADRNFGKIVVRVAT